VTPQALAALHAVCFSHPRPWSAAEFAGLLGSPGVILLTAPSSLPDGRSSPLRSEERPAGREERSAFLLGRVVAGEAEVLTLAVAPAARRQGSAAALLARFLAAAAAAGAVRAVLEVAEDNAAARALYARAGFAEVGRRRSYAGPGVDALVLARDLAPGGTAEI
jgi:ribosomal-protein-alanine N-acetyltransferase